MQRQLTADELNELSVRQESRIVFNRKAKNNKALKKRNGNTLQTLLCIMRYIISNKMQ